MDLTLTSATLGAIVRGMDLRSLDAAEFSAISRDGADNEWAEGVGDA